MKGAHADLPNPPARLVCVCVCVLLLGRRSCLPAVQSGVEGEVVERERVPEVTLRLRKDPWLRKSPPVPPPPQSHYRLCRGDMSVSRRVCR